MIRLTPTKLACKPWCGLACSHWRGDDDGFALVLAAVLLAALGMLAAYFLNVGLILIARTRLQTMAELAVAGGGRVVAEAIAQRASDNVNVKKMFPPPDAEQTKHPELFLTPNDRQDLQNDPILAQKVSEQAAYYLDKNNVYEWIDVIPSLQVDYPSTINNCDGAKPAGIGNQKTVEVLVTITRAEPLLLERLAVLATGSPNTEIKASSFYSIPLCQN